MKTIAFTGPLACLFVSFVAWTEGPAGPDPAAGDDRLKQLQINAIARRKEKLPRAYHFGSQGAGDVFSNHTSHSNRLIPIYTFGRKVDLGAVTGANSGYRDPERVRGYYGQIPERTVNPTADYCDQSDLYRVQREAIKRGVKHLFVVWFDGMDWEVTRAASIARTGRVYAEGKGSGLFFQDYTAENSAQYGFYVTSPTHDKNTPNYDTQTVSIPATSLAGGYDPEIAGPNPWTLGPLGPRAPGYLKGQGGSALDKKGVAAVGGVLHAYTDSSTSAGEFATGVKAYNNGINVTDDGQFVPTLFAQLQGEGWRVGTVTSVPFNHASPAAMYAHNVHRDDYQDLGREMLGLPSIVQTTHHGALLPGLDVVMGTGSGLTGKADSMSKQQGKNAVTGNPHITDADKAAIDVRNGGRYVVVETAPNVNGATRLKVAAAKAAREGHRLFGFYGKKTFNHLPFRTADGRFDPVSNIAAEPSILAPGDRLAGKSEVYTANDLLESPQLTDMTEAALTVLTSRQGAPFALFVEAGDVDFALHSNNLDNAVGAIYSGDDAFRTIVNWVETHSNWDDSAVILTADHGHYLVLDDPQAIAGVGR